MTSSQIQHAWRTAANMKLIMSAFLIEKSPSSRSDYEKIW